MARRARSRFAEGATTGGLDLLHRCLHAIGVAGEDGDVVTVLGESPHRGAAHPRRASRHHHYPSTHRSLTLLFDGLGRRYGHSVTFPMESRAKR